MAGKLYDSFMAGGLGLRDHLATARTILASERTFLAYQRTALTEFVAAATLIKFFDGAILIAIGWALLPIAAITAWLGVVRYRRMRSLVHDMEHGGVDVPD